MKTKKVRPVLVETKDTTSPLWSYKGRRLYYNQANFNDPDEIIYFQLVLVSLEDDEIEIGDYVYFGYHIFKVTTALKDALIVTNPIEGTQQTLIGIDGFKKVIATQDQIPDDYIEEFVYKYGFGKAENIEIKMEGFVQSSTWEYDDPEGYKPKLTNGFVTIVEKEPILYSKRDLISLLEEYEQTLDDTVKDEWYTTTKELFKDMKEQFLDWLEQNKKK